MDPQEHFVSQLARLGLTRQHPGQYSRHLEITDRVIMVDDGDNGLPRHDSPGFCVAVYTADDGDIFAGAGSTYLYFGDRGAMLTTLKALLHAAGE